MHFKMMAAAVAMMFAAPAVAQTAPSSDAPAPKPVKEKKVCRRTDAPTGSMLGASLICHTKAEWDKVDEANAHGTEDFLRRSRTSLGAGSR